jgi:hypothetical protein
MVFVSEGVFPLQNDIASEGGSDSSIPGFQAQM